MQLDNPAHTQTPKHTSKPKSIASPFQLSSPLPIDFTLALKRLQDGRKRKGVLLYYFSQTTGNIHPLDHFFCAFQLSTPVCGKVEWAFGSNASGEMLPLIHPSQSIIKGTACWECGS